MSLPTPMAVPRVDDKIDCEPALAVISAKFSLMAKERCIAALDAEAAKNEIFLPTFATEAMGRKYAGTNGVDISSNDAKDIDKDATIRHLLGSASNLFETTDAKITPPTHNIFMIRDSCF